LNHVYSCIKDIGLLYQPLPGHIVVSPFITSERREVVTFYAGGVTKTQISEIAHRYFFELIDIKEPQYFFSHRERP